MSNRQVAKLKKKVKLHRKLGVKNFANGPKKTYFVNYKKLAFGFQRSLTTLLKSRSKLQWQLTRKSQETSGHIVICYLHVKPYIIFFSAKPVRKLSNAQMFSNFKIFSFSQCGVEKQQLHMHLQPSWFVMHMKTNNQTTKNLYIKIIPNPYVCIHDKNKNILNRLL